MTFSDNFSIRAVPTSNGKIAVQWGGFTVALGHSVKLVRGFSDSSAVTVLEDATQGVLFIDEELNIRNISVYPHYWLEAEGSVNYGNLSKSPKATVAGPVDKVFFTLVDEFKKALQLVDGVQAAILLVRRDTERCPECWNFMQSARMGAANGQPCSCYGTGWKDGFWPPVYTVMRFMDNMTIGKLFARYPVPVFDNQYTVQLAGYPYLQEGDILVDLLRGKRLRVMQVNTIDYRHRIPLFQLAGVDELTATDEAYLYPISDLKFTVPENLKQTSRMMW